MAALARIKVINRCLLASGRLFRLPASGAPLARSVNACQPPAGASRRRRQLGCAIATPSRRSAFAALDSRHKANPGCSPSGSRQGLCKWAAPTLACFRSGSPRAHCSHWRTSALAPHFPRLPVPALLPPRRVRRRAPLAPRGAPGRLGGGCPAPRAATEGVFPFVAGGRYRGCGSVLPPPVPPLGGAPSGC